MTELEIFEILHSTQNELQKSEAYVHFAIRKSEFESSLRDSRVETLHNLIFLQVEFAKRILTSLNKGKANLAQLESFAHQYLHFFRQAHILRTQIGFPVFEPLQKLIEEAFPDLSQNIDSSGSSDDIEEDITRAFSQMNMGQR